MQILNLCFKKIDRSKNNLEKLSTKKVGEHIPSGSSMSTTKVFKDIKNKQDLYRGNDYMSKFCKCLKKLASRIINFKKKKIKVLANEQKQSNEKVKLGMFVEKSVEKKRKIFWQKNYCKVRDHCHYTFAAHSVYYSKYSIPKELPQFFTSNETVIIILSSQN